MTETKTEPTVKPQPVTEFSMKVGSKPLKGYLMYAYAMLTANARINKVSITGRDMSISKACQVAQILRSKLPNLNIVLSSYEYDNKNGQKAIGTQIAIEVFKPKGKGE